MPIGFHQGRFYIFGDWTGKIMVGIEEVQEFGIKRWRWQKIYELNLEAARLAKEAVEEFTLKDPDKPRIAAGSLGPTNKSLSISPDVNNPGFRSVTFLQMKDSYKEQARGLIDGGVDILIACNCRFLY